MKFSD